MRHLDDDRLYPRVDAAQVGAIEAAITELPNVDACRVVTSQTGVVTDVYILADASKAAKQVVRDAQTMVQTRCRFGIDHLVCSVVCLDSESIARTHEHEHEHPYVRLVRFVAGAALGRIVGRNVFDPRATRAHPDPSKGVEEARTA